MGNPRSTPEERTDGLATRQHQMFLRLDEAEMQRVRRFGTVLRFGATEFLMTAGQTPRGIFFMLSGRVAVMGRDGMGNTAPIVAFGAGDFVAELGTLSGKPSLVDAMAMSACDTVVLEPRQLRALIIAEAELAND